MPESRWNEKDYLIVDCGPLTIVVELQKIWSCQSDINPTV